MHLDDNEPKGLQAVTRLAASSRKAQTIRAELADAIRAAAASGTSYSRIALAAGLSKQRIHQIVHDT